MQTSVQVLSSTPLSLQEIRVTLPGYGTAAARAALPIPVSVCGIFMSKQCYGCRCLGLLTCTLMLMYAIAQWGCTDTVREFALEVDWGKKSLAVPGTLCVQYFRVPRQWYGCRCLRLLTCTLMLMYATAQWGCADTVRESALKLDSWGKNPLLYRGLELTLVLRLVFVLDTLPAELSPPHFLPSVPVSDLSVCVCVCVLACVYVCMPMCLCLPCVCDSHKDVYNDW